MIRRPLFVGLCVVGTVALGGGPAFAALAPSAQAVQVPTTAQNPSGAPTSPAPPKPAPAKLPAAPKPTGAVGRIAPHQDLVLLEADHVARTEPSEQAPYAALVHAYRPLTGAPTVLPLLGHARTLDGTLWLEVRLPGRSLGGPVPPPTGWILANAVSYGGTSWHIVIGTTKQVAIAFYGGRVIRTFRVITGAPATPTPKGEYFVEENVQLRPQDVGAPYALALSARSPVLQEFAGGPGQIAMHGLQNVGGRLGTAVSHGCIRFANEGITWLADRIGAGTPVTVR